MSEIYKQIWTGDDPTIRKSSLDRFWRSQFSNRYKRNLAVTLQTWKDRIMIWKCSNKFTYFNDAITRKVRSLVLRMNWQWMSLPKILSKFCLRTNSKEGLQREREKGSSKILCLCKLKVEAIYLLTRQNFGEFSLININSKKRLFYLHF